MLINSFGSLGAAALLCSSGVLAASVSAQAKQSVVEGNARFQVLSPTLIRMEYSPTASFIDAPSAAVLKRDWPETPFTSSKDGEWLVISAGKMTLRYKSGSGPFTTENLSVSWKDGAGDHSWKPGDKDDQNLGGVVGDIAIRSTPVVDPGPLSRKGCFLLDDSTTAIRDEAAQWVKPRPAGGGQDRYFFAYGHDYAHALGELTQLLGPVPMVPRYVLGAWFGSRAGYSSDEFKMIVERYREEKLPLDVLVLDSMSWTSVVWSGYDFDPEQMPDPKGFFQWNLKQGVHVTLNEHYAPITKQSDRNFEAIRQAMGLPADTKEIGHDVANKRYVQLFMDLLHKPALDMGMAFWWQDGSAGSSMPGLDPMMWTREVEYQGQERITNRRGFVFCRLGTWGSHRSGGFFSSDLIPQWNTLSLLVPFTQQSGNQLVPYTINLCAGVYGVNIDPELYQRWVQFSSFSPIFWFHGLWGMRLPWEYGPAGMETYRKFLGLRYALMPYTYTCARVAHDTGLPLVRGLYIEYPGQDAVYSHKQQYMFGNELLVAPVTEPAYGKPALKDICLPAGSDWYDYFTGDIYRGGQVISYECPLERMPVFVRSGSIVPSGPRLDYTGQKPADPLVVSVYAGKAASFRLYEDDGDSLEYRKGAFAWTPLTYTPASGAHTMTIGPAEGQYAGQPKARRYEVRVNGLLKPRAIKINGKTLDEMEPEAWGGGWNWDTKNQVTTIRLADPVPVKTAIELTLEDAGSYEDALALHRVSDYRERIRRVKHELKLKYSIAVNGAEHGKPPRVIQETEEVERQLGAMVAEPRGLAGKMPDFKAMTQRVLSAFTNKPFDSTRKIPDLNPSCQQAAQAIANVTFEPTELRKMTAILLGLEMPARVVWDAPAHHTVGPFLHIRTKLNYDAGAIGPAKVSYELDMPEDGLPGWVQGTPGPAEDGYTQFNIQHPHPARLGGHTFRVRAILKWEGGHAQTEREIEWLSTGLP